MTLLRRENTEESLERNDIMEKLTRRKLIKQASVSAGVVGLLATTVACASPNSTQPAATSNSAQLTATSAQQANIPADPLAVFVTDPARGTLVIMRGESEFTVTNPSLAQTLLAL
jgi:hypothetical protein